MKRKLRRHVTLRCGPHFVKECPSETSRGVCSPDDLTFTLRVPLTEGWSLDFTSLRRTVGSALQSFNVCVRISKGLQTWLHVLKRTGREIRESLPLPRVTFCLVT